MSFSTLENSADQGQPVQMYLFQYDVGDAYYAYTDSETPIAATIDGFDEQIIFEPASIDRDNVTSSGTLDKQTINITTPNTLALCDLYRIVPPSTVTQLTIFQAHFGDAQALVCWAGRVLSVNSAGDEKTFTCEPIQTSLKRIGLRRNWQLGCPHLLYGPKCKADMNAATVQVVALAVNGPEISLPANWSTPELQPDFQGGIMSWLTEDNRTEHRTILQILDAQTILVSAQALTVPPGGLISLAKGCPHDEASCLRIHNNINNYGGQSKIPTTNPTGVKNMYY